jgi:hypothetical protein
VIDDWIQDPLAHHNCGMSLSSQISTELACLLVTFPLYLFVMRVILTETRQAPEN